MSVIFDENYPPALTAEEKRNLKSIVFDRINTRRFCFRDRRGRFMRRPAEDDLRRIFTDCVAMSSAIPFRVMHKPVKYSRIGG